MLAADEAETVAQLQDEVAQLVDELALQFAFLHRLADTQELQVVAALERFLGLFGQGGRQHAGEVVALGR